MPVALLRGLQRRGQRRRALSKSRSALAIQAQLEALFSPAPFGVVQTDVNGRIWTANDRFRRLLRLGPVQAEWPRLIELVAPQDRPRFLAAYQGMLEFGRPCRVELRLVRADRTYAWVSGDLAVVGDGRTARVLAAFHSADPPPAPAGDAAARDGRAQRMEALGRLAGGVAHDFNNVLQAIAGGANLIQRRLDDPEAVGRLATLLVDAAQRGTLVTQRLMAFARRGPLEPAAIDVSDALLRLRHGLAGVAGGPEIRISVPFALPPVLADPAQFETVLTSLATNARDAVMEGRAAAPGGQGAPELVLSAVEADGDEAGLPPGRYVRIDVSDNGPGMDAVTLGRATEPFFTTKPRVRGTGLGLAMAEGFAEQSGGGLVLRSAIGLGTTASLFLPQADPPDAWAGAGPVPAGRASIVVVDDDADVRSVVCELLGALGYSARGFASAAAALSHLDGGAPADLLITDFAMPAMDGMALIRSVRQHRPSLPAILLTGYRTDIGLASGGAGVVPPVALVPKPVRVADLAAAVAAKLERRAMDDHDRT